MTTQEAKTFLRNNQPLPDDDALSRKQTEILAEVVNHVASTRDKACIPLLLGVFGRGNGLGTYLEIEELLLQFPKSEVVPHLCQGLASVHASVRFWNAQLAVSFPDLILVEPLAPLLKTEDYDLKYAALSTLERIDSPRVREIAREYLEWEWDDGLRSIAREIAGK